jgi:hypothetical protein
MRYIQKREDGKTKQACRPKEAGTQAQTRMGVKNKNKIY